MLKKRLLYIDPLSFTGHVNFNKIYIKELYKMNLNINFVFKDGYSHKLGVKNDVLTIPNEFYSSNKGLLTRLNNIRILRYIDKKISLEDYDYVILSSYDTISLFFSGIKCKLILVNHNTLQGLENRIKRFFFKSISKNNIHIVFEEYMKDYLSTIGVHNVNKISHGFMKSITKTEINKNFFFEGSEVSLNDFEKVLFIPSLHHLDQIFIENLIIDKGFVSFLESNNILLVIKTNLKIKNESINIQFIMKNLTKREYQTVFLRSNLIIIKYPLTYKYRISAIFLECVVNNKTCLLNKTDALIYYKKYINYESYYETKEDLYNQIIKNLDLDISIKFSKWMNAKSDFKKFFELN
jgi:hypothetical protein